MELSPGQDDQVAAELLGGRNFGHTFLDGITGGTDRASPDFAAEQISRDASTHWVSLTPPGAVGALEGGLDAVAGGIVADALEQVAPGAAHRIRLAPLWAIRPTRSQGRRGMGTSPALADGARRWSGLPFDSLRSLRGAPSTRDARSGEPPDDTHPRPVLRAARLAI